MIDNFANHYNLVNAGNVVSMKPFHASKVFINHEKSNIQSIPYGLSLRMPISLKEMSVHQKGRPSERLVH